MKTVLKRLLSFVLVAMMLVSVMPFQASADTTVQVSICETDKWDAPIETRNVTFTDSTTISLKAIYERGIEGLDTHKYAFVEMTVWGVAGQLDVTSDASITPESRYCIEVTNKEVSWTAKVVAGSTTLDSNTSITAPLDAEVAELTGLANSWLNGRSIKALIDAGKYTADAAGWKIDREAKTITLSVTPAEFTVTLNVKAGVSTASKTIKKNYNTECTLNAQEIVEYDTKLFTAGDWDVTGASVASVKDGQSFVVIGDATADITLTPTGYKTSKLWAKNSAGEWVSEGTLYWKSGEKIEGWKAAPSVGTTTGFTKWNSQQDGKGVDLPGGNLGATEILLDNYYAQYETDYNNGNAEVRVTAVYFVDGIEHHRSSQYVLTLEVPAGTNVMTAEWLNSAGNKQAIERGIADNARNIDSYTWDGGFYNSSFSTSYASTGLKANGNTNVYVKVNADKSELEDVYLYIHKNTTSKDPAQIVSMKGYVGDDYVTLADAKEVAKKNDWRADSYKIYSDNDWKQLVAGGNPDGNGEEVRVNDGTNTIVHILLKNGYKTSGTADNSNYKTGDTIMIAVTALGLSASALVVLYLVNKKKRAL